MERPELFSLLLVNCQIIIKYFDKRKSCQYHSTCAPFIKLLSLHLLRSFNPVEIIL